MSRSTTPGASRPLAGVTVVVARPVEAADALADLVEEAGATALVVPLIEIVDPPDPARTAATLADLEDVDWVVVTSPNAATRVAAAVTAHPAVRVAAVGATTAAALPRADLVPEHQRASGLVDVFPTGTGRVVVCQAAAGAPTLVDGVRAKGWQVTRIDTHDVRPVRPTARQQLAVLKADVLLLTSGSQARAWTEAFGTAAPPVVAAIGPQTAADAAAAGLKVDLVATDHSLGGLVDALRSFWGRQ